MKLNIFLNGQCYSNARLRDILLNIYIIHNIIYIIYCNLLNVFISLYIYIFSKWVWICIKLIIEVVDIG